MAFQLRWRTCKHTDETKAHKKDADATASLASVLVSRFMFNLREPREMSVTTVSTAATSSTRIPMTTILRTLTDAEGDNGAAVFECPLHKRFTV